LAAENYNSNKLHAIRTVPELKHINVRNNRKDRHYE